jgi:hypothetical protein
VRFLLQLVQELALVMFLLLLRVLHGLLLVVQLRVGVLPLVHVAYPLGLSLPELEQLGVLLHARDGLLVAQALLLGEGGRVFVVIVDLEDVSGEVLLPAGRLLAAVAWLHKSHLRQELLLRALLDFVGCFSGGLLLALRRFGLPIAITAEAIKLCLLHVAYVEGLLLLLLQVQPWLDQLLIGLQFHVLVLVPVGHLTGRRHS